MILETFKKFWIIGETVRIPSFVHEVWASEVLKNCFCEMARCLATAQSPVRVERRKKGTATALESILILAKLCLKPELGSGRERSELSS